MPRGVLIALAILGGIVLLGGGGLAALRLSPLWPDCTVGYGGTNLNINVQGLGAAVACQELIKSAPGGVSSPGQTPLGSGYETSPTGTLICSVSLNRLRYTVRDSGLLMLYGTAFCSYLQSQTPAANSTSSS